MDRMAFELDWELEFSAFKKSIRALIRESEKQGKVIPIPFTQRASFDTASIILSQIKCDKCDALCCRVAPNGEPLGITKDEYIAFADKFGESKLKSLGIKLDGVVGSIPIPCPFLKSDMCTIYSDRPLVCILYPLDTGGTDDEGNILISVASHCPEARRIARDILISFYRMRKQCIRAGLSKLGLVDDILGRRGICLRK